MSEETKKFIEELTNLLAERKFEDAQELFTMYRGIIPDIMSDIIRLVSDYLTVDNKKYKELFKCCKFILNTIAKECNPKETVLEFLAQMESLDSNIGFCIFLEPLSICLNKMKNKIKIIEWSIHTIKLYVEGLPVRTFEEYDGDEIINVYIEIMLFVEVLMQDDSKTKSNPEEESLFEHYLLGLLISLYGKPFCYLSNKIIKSLIYKQLSERLMTFAFRVNGNILYFLDVVSNRYRNIICDKKTDIDIFTKSYIHHTLFDLSSNISNLAYANFYYHIFTEKVLWANVPQVYNIYYIFEMCIYFVNILLCQEETILISKGLTFLEHILKRIPRRSIESQVLQLKIYSDLFKPIIKVMVFSQHYASRTEALHNFRKYIEIFNMEARYCVISHLYEISEHSGLLSIITGIFKSSIIECLRSTPRSSHFLGNNMKWLLKKACKLPHGSSSDLAEISDEIITVLNLLRFLFISDKHNETGIWNMKETLENDYLKPLSEGINLCKMHWEVKIKDLEQQKKEHVKVNDYDEMKRIDEQVILIVGGEQLPLMPVKEKLEFCCKVINGLNIMESVLIRVNECFRSLWTSRVLLTDQSENDHRKANTQSSVHEESDEEYEKNIKTKILGASLKFVPELGWSKQTISAGAEFVGYPGVIHGLFPNGGAALVQYFYSKCNYELNEILKKEALAIQEDPSKPRKIAEHQVRDAVVTRLKMIIPYKKTWPQAIAIMTLPPNVPTALANLLTLADDICYYAGDRSVDFNWYSRRMMLATIYKATELYMLQDTSEDHKETWLFLERRIKDALQIHTIFCSSTDTSSPDEAVNRATDTVTAVFVTARNILGLNR